MKTYNLSWHETVHGISYPNLIMLSAVIPDYDTDTDTTERGSHHTQIRADDPKNNERIRQLLHKL